MPDGLPPAPPSPDFTEPTGLPTHAIFAGILEGRCGQAEDLRQIVADLNALRLARVDLEIDGGRFSALLDERPVDGDRMEPATLRAFEQGLQRLIEASADPRSVESTMRGTAIHENAAVETLFAAVGGNLQVAQRTRAILPTDVTPTGDGPQALGRNKSVMIGVLMIVAVILLVWESGILHRFQSPDVADLTIRSSFGSMLGYEVVREWGNYKVTVGRGETYPVTQADVDRLASAAADAAGRAAVQAVGSGELAYLRLLDADGDLVSYRRLPLRGLLLDPASQVMEFVPGHADAATLQIALAP